MIKDSAWRLKRNRRTLAVGARVSSLARARVLVDTIGAVAILTRLWCTLINVFWKRLFRHSQSHTFVNTYRSIRTHFTAFIFFFVIVRLTALTLAVYASVASSTSARVLVDTIRALTTIQTGSVRTLVNVNCRDKANHNFNTCPIIQSSLLSWICKYTNRQ